MPWQIKLRDDPRVFETKKNDLVKRDPGATRLEQKD